MRNTSLAKTSLKFTQSRIIKVFTEIHLIRYSVY